MDKSKLLTAQNPVKRAVKGKAPLPGSANLYALGTSTTSNSSSSSSSSTASSIGAKTVTKREQNPAIPNAVAKKLKLLQASTIGSASSKPQPSLTQQWDEKAQEVDPIDLVKFVQDAIAAQKTGQAVAFVCGAIKQLKGSRTKPESTLYLSLLYLVKSRPTLFQNELLVDAFCSLLRKESANPKMKLHPFCLVLAANVMQAAFAEEVNWPSQFIKVYVEDALGDRVWVDHELCKCFVDNLLTAFGTRLPSRQLLSDQTTSGSGFTPVKIDSPASASPSHPLTSSSAQDENSQDKQLATQMSVGELRERLLAEQVGVQDRFASSSEVMAEHVLSVINEQLNRRQVSSEINKHLLKLLISVAGLSQARAQAAQRLEIWLQNPKLGRTAQDLLAAVCLNCNDKDGETFSFLMRMRLKTKPLVNHFVASIRELITLEPRLVSLVLRCAVNNELGQSRGGNNMQLLAMLFQVEPVSATASLASHIQHMLCKDDCIRQVRQLLRELIRALRHEHLNLTLLVSHLTEWSEHYAELDPLDFTSRDRVCSSITDLLVLCMFLCVSPAVKESQNAPRGDPRREVIRTFHSQLAEIQRMSVKWLHVGLNRLHSPDRNEFVHWLNKLLLMESPELYCNKDNWPPEAERNLVFRLTMEIPVLEETFERLLNMGFSKEHQVNATEVIELIDTLIRRAASLYDGEISTSLQLQSDHIFRLLLDSAAYRTPENIALPANYDPPNMAIADWYWKVWLQLLVLVCHNCSKIGKIVSEGAYPTLAMMIEMVITNQYEYPPSSRSDEDWRSFDNQSAATEKQLILQFESHLAAASTKIQINENNSLLLSKLISFDPNGPARRPPTSVLEQLRALNSQLRLGHLLCQSREPDFLLQIIQKHEALNQSSTGAQGSNAVTHHGLNSMSWLVELVEMNADSFHLLPCQCLCEYVLGQFIEAEEQGYANIVTSSVGTVSTTNAFNNSVALVSHLAGVNAVANNPMAHPTQLSLQERSRRKEKRRKLIKLVLHLQYLLRSDAKAAEQLLNYFMKKLSFPQAGTRALAVRILGTLFTYPQQQNNSWEEDGSWPFVNHVDCDQWLLNRMPQLQFFSQLRRLICSCLQDAILVEALPQLVCGYIQFLAIHKPNPDRALTRALARLLIERPIMTKCLTQGEYREAFLSACAKLFYQHMTQAMELGVGEEAIQSFSILERTGANSGSEEDSTSSQGNMAATIVPKLDPNDVILVRWPQAEALFNLRIAHALMLLLSFGPSVDERLLYEELLELWSEPTPEAFSLDGESRMSNLIPDWLKLRFIRSSIPSLVDCALRDLQINQLLLFIQTFGIPIVSMEKLLTALDLTCKHDPDAVRSCIGNVNLIKQLIEVQFSRGVKSGQFFAELIGIH